MCQKYLQKGSYLIIALIFFTMIAIALVACASQSTTKSTQSVVENPVAAFEQEVERLRKKYKIPGMSVAILQNQQVKFAGGFGYADIENKIPATANTPYNIASLSKTFASAVLMKLVEKDQLDLDTAIADILENTLFT